MQFGHRPWYHHRGYFRQGILFARYLCASVLAVSAVVAALAFGGTHAPVAFGSAGCQADQSIRTGPQLDPAGYNPWGARADIQVIAANLCSPIPSRPEDNTAWVMLSSDCTGCGWAQIGYTGNRNYGSGTMRYFYEWEKSDSDPRTDVFFGAPGGDSRHTFNVHYDPNVGHIVMLLDGSQAPCGGGGCAETNFGLSAWGGGTHDLWEGEASNPGSDVPGDTLDKDDFWQVQIMHATGDWQDPATYDGSGTGQCYLHFAYVTQYTHFQTWTNPLGHVC
jgi:hypothetical protein